jgi:hypothetical protein
MAEAERKISRRQACVAIGGRISETIETDNEKQTRRERKTMVSSKRCIK